jgi:hypothetical protein
MALIETRETMLNTAEQPQTISGAWWLSKVIETTGTGKTKQHIKYHFEPPVKVIFNIEKELLVCYIGDYQNRKPLLFQDAGQGRIRVMHFRTLDLLEGKYTISGQHMKWLLEKNTETPLLVAAYFQQYATSKPPKNTKAKDVQIAQEPQNGQPDTQNNQPEVKLLLQGGNT